MVDWFLKAYPDVSYREMVAIEWSREIQVDGSYRPPTHIFEVIDLWDRAHTVEFLVLKGEGSSLVILKDITMEKMQEKERFEAGKLKALGQLAGGIAHDFNNQLGGIMGFTELLRESIEKDSPEYGYLSSIMSAGETSARLIEQLLSYSRKTTMEMHMFDLREELERLHKIAQRTLPASIKLSYHFNSPSHSVYGNASQLNSLFLNLIINAKDSMNHGGEINVSTEKTYLKESMVNGLDLREGNYLLVSVKDQGTGMTPELIEHIFEPFFTTKDKKHGTGMGLAMAYSTLKSHTGSIEALSSPGEGTLFKVYLPLT